MTCVVAIGDGKNVWMGADTASSGGWISQRVSESKLIRRGEFIFGYSGSWRVGQLLKYKFTPPKHYEDKSDSEYLAIDFIDSLRSVLRDNGALRKKDEEEHPQTYFLLGYHGQVYLVHNDLQMIPLSDNFTAIGSGYEVALGSLHTTKTDDNINKRLRSALEAAADYAYGVEPPFVFEKV